MASISGRAVLVTAYLIAPVLPAVTQAKPIAFANGW
jgi:hypothetical protein